MYKGLCGIGCLLFWMLASITTTESAWAVIEETITTLVNDNDPSRGIGREFSEEEYASATSPVSQETPDITSSGVGGTPIGDTTVKVTSTAPVSGCKEGDKYDNCVCRLSISLDGYCAAACSSGYVWCTNSICDASAGDNYICKCAPDYYKEGQSCLKGKYFSGLLVLSPTARSSSNDYLNLVISIYSSSAYYVNSTILAEEYPNVYYQLTYQNVEIVDSEYVEQTFSMNCNSTEIDLNCSLSNLDQSFLCANDNSAFSDACDSVTANCNVDSEGIFYCSCREPTKYVKPSPDATSCSKIICSENKDCANGGTCSSDTGDPLNNQCKCNFGFSGDICEDAWELVFTVVTTILGVALIGVLVACIYQTKKDRYSEKFREDSYELDFENPFGDFQPNVVRAKSKIGVSDYSVNQGTNEYLDHRRSTFNDSDEEEESF